MIQVIRPVPRPGQEYLHQSPGGRSMVSSAPTECTNGGGIAGNNLLTFGKYR